MTTTYASSVYTKQVYGYMGELIVKQLEKDTTDGGSVLRVYKFIASQLTFLLSILLVIATIRLKNSQLSGYSYFTAKGGSRAGVSGIGVV